MLAAAAAGLVVVLVAGYLAFAALQAPQQAVRAGVASPAACAPAPCTNVQGYTLWVSNVVVQGDLVRMDVKFKNASQSTHASPEDLQLVDAAGHSSPIVTGASACDTWARHEFANGTTFGPIGICFRVTTPPPFVLRWSPDLGFFCCSADIKISA